MSHLAQSSLETRLKPPDKEPTPRGWDARLCYKMTAHLATAGLRAPVGPQSGGGGPQRPGRDGRDCSGKSGKMAIHQPLERKLQAPSSQASGRGDGRGTARVFVPRWKPGLRTPGARGQRESFNLRPGSRGGALRDSLRAQRTHDLRPDSGGPFGS